MGLGSIGNQCTDLSYSKHALGRFDLDQISQPCSYGLEIMGPALIMNTITEGPRDSLCQPGRWRQNLNARETHAL
jgi:hypothetical protein